MRLYELTNEYQQLLGKIEESETIEGTDELKEKLECIEDNVEEKIKNTGIIIKLLEVDLNLIDQEIEKLKKKKSSVESKIEWLKSNLCINMQKMNIKRIENKPYFNITLKLGQPKVKTTNEQLIPIEYKKIKETINLDKIKMRDEMLAGVIIPGAELVRENYVFIQ